MTKVVINCCYGGFCLSQRAIDRYNEYVRDQSNIDANISQC